MFAAKSYFTVLVKNKQIITDIALHQASTLHFYRQLYLLLVLLLIYMKDFVNMI